VAILARGKLVAVLDLEGGELAGSIDDLLGALAW
jgi:hypothetical protein